MCLTICHLPLKKYPEQSVHLLKHPRKSTITLSHESLTRGFKATRGCVAQWMASSLPDSIKSASRFAASPRVKPENPADEPRFHVCHGLYTLNSPVWKVAVPKGSILSLAREGITPWKCGPFASQRRLELVPGAKDSEACASFTHATL